MRKIYKAIADFQQEVPTIHKGTDGYNYSYASLNQIYEVILPLLKKHGLGFIQPLEGNTLKTIIFHIESGESVESTANIPMDVQLAKMNPYQVMGSAITYFRRYTLSSMLGLITDVDNDAQGEYEPNNSFIQQTTQKPYPTDKQMKALIEKAQEIGSVKAIAKAKEHFTLSAEQLSVLNNLTAF